MGRVDRRTFEARVDAVRLLLLEGNEPAAIAQDMFEVFGTSASAHYVAMCNYMLSDPALHAAINARDWPEIGRRYNGAASAGELYKAAYVRLWGG